MTQRGSRPSVTRCTQNVHFSTTPLGRAGVSPTTVTLAGGSCTGLRQLKTRLSYGQATMQ